jgi:septation ring formation regulator EzrA
MRWDNSDAPRWNDSVILEVKQELGEITGRITAMETSMKETREDVKEILKCTATIPEVQRMIVQHDKRIGDLEQKSALFDAAAVKLEEHLREDEPADRYVDRNIAAWVKRGLWVAATGVLGWVVAKVTGK